MLAEAFCLADERVEAAKAALEEAQSERTRMLAALSVTVGSDGAVAQLLGLAERSVRLSRRKIGRGAARQTAETVLGGAEYPEPGEPESAAPPWTPTRESTSVGSPLSGVPDARPEAPTTSTVADPSWPAAMDALLLQGWTSGVDQQVLAGQLGIDLGTLVGRIQQLTMGDRPRRTPSVPGARQPADTVPPGRHRRPVETRTAFSGAFAHPAGMPDAEYPMLDPDLVDGVALDWELAGRSRMDGVAT